MKSFAPNWKYPQEHETIFNAYNSNDFVQQKKAWRSIQNWAWHICVQTKAKWTKSCKWRDDKSGARTEPYTTQDGNLGKRGNIVPELLTAEMKEWIDILIKQREMIGISKTNPHLFPRSQYGGEGHIRGTDVIRDWSKKVGAEQPEHLRTTKLWKHIATVTY